jgi:hypothetical protein
MTASTHFFFVVNEHSIEIEIRFRQQLFEIGQILRLNRFKQIVTENFRGKIRRGGSDVINTETIE